jgi:hypothetical protein
MPSRRKTKKRIQAAATSVAAQVGEGESNADMMAALRIFEGVATRTGFVQNQLRKTHGGRRNMFHVLGYDQSPDFGDFWARYQRQDVANRIINLPVDATWGGGALEVEGFPEWDALEKRLRITARLTELDRLAGIGEYAVMLIGLKGEQNSIQGDGLEQPVESVESLEDITFLRQYSRDKVEIHSSIQDESDPRFGMPEFYEIEVTTDFSNSSTIASSPVKTRKVHWSRVLHVTSSSMLNDVVGIPRLMPILDRLHDIDKVVGGGSEAYWQSADRLFHWNAQGRVGGSSADRAAQRAEMDEVIHGIATRLLTTSNGELTTVEGRDVDPSGLAEVLMTLIASGAGIPKRILFGSERGQLASIQDRDNWADTVANRRTTYAGPCILDNWLERLHMWGVGPDPDAITPLWPDIQVQGSQERAETLEMRLKAIQAAEQAAATGQVVSIDELRAELGYGAAAQAEGELNEIDIEVDEGDADAQEQFRLQQAA